MRRRWRAIGLIPLMGLLALELGSSRQGHSRPLWGELPFSVGERLTYTISWAHYVVAGEMTLSVKGRGRFFDRAGVHLELRAQTVGPVRTLLRALEEQWTSYVDPQTWLPYRVEHSRRDGDRRTDIAIALDHRSGIARLSTGRTIAISPETRDVVAFLYHLRTLPLQPGKRYRFSVLSERRRVLIQAHVRSRAVVETRAGRFEAMEVALRVEGTDAPRLRLWLSADSRRMPVMIIAQEALGEIRVELAEVAIGTATAGRESSPAGSQWRQ